MKSTSITALSVITFLAVAATACSTPEPVEEAAPIDRPVDDPVVEEQDEVAADDIEYSADIDGFDGESYGLRIYADGEEAFSEEYIADGGQPHYLDGLFETTYCGQEVLVTILRADVNTAASVGSLYRNLIFSRPDIEFIAEYSAANVTDPEDGSVITDDQPALEESLRAGIDDPERCGDH